jgi:hypothetical protein
MGSDYELRNYYDKDDSLDHEGEPEGSHPFSFWWVVLCLVGADVGVILWLVN